MNRLRRWSSFGLLLGLMLLACRPLLGAPGLLLSSRDTPQPSATATLAAPSPAPTATHQVATPRPTPSAASPSPAPTTDQPAPTAETTPAAEATLSPAALERMERIEQDVEELRGLHATRPVEKVVITREELTRKVEEDFLADYTPEDAAKDAVELWLFGLAGRDVDWYEVHKTMLSEGIAGFYDDEEGKMYVVAEDGFPPHARLTYAHEYTHALQDQTWDLDEGLGFNDETCERDSELCAGIQALVEGDASVTEYLWFWEKATPREQEAVRRYYQSLDMPGWDASPEFMQEDILFPYIAGQDFVLALFKDGGWEAVNAAYDNPPASTEQVLHPERYPDDRPVRVDLPDIGALLGDGWEAVTEHNALGEFWLYLVLAKSETLAYRLDEDEARRAAEGWGGDAYATYYQPEGDGAVLVQKWVWDTSDDADEFTRAFLRYAEQRFGPAQSSGPTLWVWEDTEWGTVFFATVGPRGHVWVIAPDRATAQRLFEATR